MAGASARPETLATNFSAAMRPMSRIGWRIVVSEGHSREASGLSSKPMTVSSSGIFTPRRYAVRYTPAAVSSLPAKIAVGRGDHFQHQVGTEGGGIVADGRARGFEGAVRDASADAGTALHRHLVALAHQLLDGLGCRGNPRLPSVGFERNTDVHFKSPA